ncbi:protein DpdG [Rhodospirillales bacterium]|nr:protein DpdG [Rhodospirillales bacterium]
MAILNVDCQLNVLLLICDVLSEVGPTPKKELVTLCVSGVENDPNKRTLGSINQFNNIGEGVGLFDEDTNQTISFAKEYQEIDKCPPQERLEKLPKLLRRAIFSNQLKDDFMTSNEGSNDINRAFAWLLSQDVYTMSLANNPMFELEREQFKKTRERVLDDNSSRTRNMREWGTFLGFIDQSSNDAIIDPTRAIQETLPDVFGRKKELKAEEFIKRLAEELPPLDGGKFRNAVEKCLDTKSWNKPEDGVLSKSLSRALWRLHKNPKTQFQMEPRADAGSWGLDLPQGANPRSFSHVRGS